MALEQGDIMIAAYETRFHTLSKYATLWVIIEKESIWLFIKGLNPKLQVSFVQ